jgi:hypothetical protein
VGRGRSAVWVEKLFEAKVPARNIIRKAEREREKLTTTVVNDPTPENDSEIPKNQEIKWGGGSFDLSPIKIKKILTEI